MAGRKKHVTKRISYKREVPRVRLPKPEGNQDLRDEGLRMLEASLEPRHNNQQPPDGTCQECGKAVPPMRRLCGRCQANKPNGGRDG